MDRRAFVNLATALGLSSWVGQLAYAQGAGQPRIRKDASSAAAAKDIAAYRRGVAALKSNTTATDYDSWMFWANSHGTPHAIPPSMRKVWYQCEHGTPHFLTWHRAYLYFFESLLREKSGEDSFALPYWSWFASKALPSEFTSPQVDGQPNSLFHSARNPSNRTLLSAPLSKSSFNEFGSNLEGNPHGTVHVMVGGEMGAVETSARDPIFWMHHCNIDRLWLTWLSQDSTRRNPTEVAWLEKKFTFDVSGSKSLHVHGLLETASTLNYSYDSLTLVGNPADAVPIRPQVTVEVPLAQGAASLGTQPLSKPISLSKKLPLALKGGSVSLDFSIPRQASSRMNTMSVSTTKAPSLTLVLKDVKATPAGIQRGGDYRIYLNLPRDRKDIYKHNDFYLGSINTFALSHHQGAHAETFTFDLAPFAPTLTRHGLWTNTKVSISLMSDDENSTQPLIEIGDVQLLISDAPLK